MFNGRTGTNSQLAANHSQLHLLLLPTSSFYQTAVAFEEVDVLVFPVIDLAEGFFEGDGLAVAFFGIGNGVLGHLGNDLGEIVLQHLAVSFQYS
jgi:hypothetical protein